MDQDYQELITTVSSQIAQLFLTKEANIAQRALLVDADIAEITRQIGLETTTRVLKQTCEQLVKKTNQKA
jgi:hypothetical protein